jgi:hypothetical protein
MAEPCNDMLEPIVDLVQGALAPGRIDTVRTHLDACEACRAYYEAVLADGRMLAGYAASHDQAVARIEANVMEKVKSQSNASMYVRRVKMGSDFLKVTLAAAVILIVAIIGRGYYMIQNEPTVTVAVAPEPEPIDSQLTPEPVAVSTPRTSSEPQMAQTVTPAASDEEIVVGDDELVPGSSTVAMTDEPLGTPGAGMAPLPLKLPKPMFVGTPTNINVPNLQKPLGKPRPPFYAPAGCVNLAAGKTVISTDDMPIIGEIDMITDGDKEAADGSYVELGPFLQHITVDLEQQCEIYAVLVWHYHKQARVYFDVIVQVADDPDFITNVKTLFNNDIDNSAGLGIGKDMHYIETSEGKLIDAKGVEARYVRFYSCGSNANDLNNYIEVEVWGRPAADAAAATEDEKTADTPTDTEEAAAAPPGLQPLPIVLPKPMFVGTPTNISVPNLQKPLGKPRPPFYAPAGCVNLAAGKTVVSTDDMPIIGEIDMITDGDKEAADGSYVELGPFLQHITVDLEQQCEIYAVLVWHYHKQARVYFDVIVQVADDPDFITNVKTLFNNDIDNSAGLGIGKDMHYIETSEGKLIDAKGVEARYVRFYSCGSNANDLNNYIEIEVWGKPKQ